MDSGDKKSLSYESLGLRTDPFDVSWVDSDDGVGVKMSVQAASQRLVGALDEMVDDPDHRPIIVEKGDVPAFYHIMSLSRALRLLALQEPVPGIASLYVPIDMMRIGRARAVLHNAAEWVAGVDPVLTIAALSARAFAEPEESLVEWRALCERESDLQALRDDLATDPQRAAQQMFGEPLQSRTGAEDAEMMMRVAAARVDRLEVDPEEGESAPGIGEEATDDPMSEALTMRLGEVDPAALEEAPSFEHLAAEYVIAYARSVLSPVIARGLQAYRAQGTASMTEEMKVSKAPTKTVAALLRLAAMRMRATAIIFDRFEMWVPAPQELRLKIVSTITAMRWAVKDYAGIVLMLPVGEAPEAEEAFASASRVSWKFDELARVESREARYDRAVVRNWIGACAPGGEAPAWADELLGAIPEDVSLEQAVASLRKVIDEAAAAGSDSPSVAVLEAEYSA